MVTPLSTLATRGCVPDMLRWLFWEASASVGSHHDPDHREPCASPCSAIGEPDPASVAQGEEKFRPLARLLNADWKVGRSSWEKQSPWPDFVVGGSATYMERGAFRSREFPHLRAWWDAPAPGSRPGTTASPARPPQLSHPGEMTVKPEMNSLVLVVSTFTALLWVPYLLTASWCAVSPATVGTQSIRRRSRLGPNACARRTPNAGGGTWRSFAALILAARSATSAPSSPRWLASLYLYGRVVAHAVTTRFGVPWLRHAGLRGGFVAQMLVAGSFWERERGTVSASSPLRRFRDNYIWMFHDGKRAVVVDPAWLSRCWRRSTNSNWSSAPSCSPSALRPQPGVPGLLGRRWVPVFGPSLNEHDRHSHPPFPVPGTVPLDCVSHVVNEGDTVTLDALDMQLAVLAVPGHTRGHLAFLERSRGWLFTGDTLFGGGCGKVFGGSMQAMIDSLDRLACLPAQTQVYCAHEYTLDNLRFALAVEPSNPIWRCALKSIRASVNRGWPPCRRR
jgi:hydroxyacylglutathione hydrolase